MKHVVVGLIVMFLGVWGMIVWFKTLGLVMRGLVPIVLVVFGLVALLSGFRRLAAANPAASDDEEDEEDEEGEEDEEDEEGEEDDRDDEALEDEAELEEDDEQPAEPSAVDAPAA